MEFCMLKTKDIKRSETYDMNLKEEEKFSHSYHEQHFIVHITIFYPETLTRKKMMFVRFFHESNKKNCHNIKGPIIYFFDGRSPSRHKQCFFIQQVCALMEHFLEGIAPLRHWYINQNEKGNKYKSSLLSSFNLPKP